MLRGVLLNAEPVLGDILDGSFIVVQSEKYARSTLRCRLDGDVDELYCHGLSMQWSQRRQLGGGKKVRRPCFFSEVN